MKIEAIGTIATAFAVAGVILNNRKMIGCFYLWLISNSISAGIHATAGIWSLCLRDLIFIALAAEGLARWRKKL